MNIFLKLLIIPLLYDLGVKVINLIIEKLRSYLANKRTAGK
jgi:hypothetical protein